MIYWKFLVLLIFLINIFINRFAENQSSVTNFLSNREKSSNQEWVVSSCATSPFRKVALPDLVSRGLSTEKQNFCSAVVTKPHHQSPPSPQEKTKQNKKNTHPSCNLKKYTVLAFKCSGGFIVYFFNSSKYLRTHFSHYRTAEAAIACCTLKQSNENNVFFYLAGIFGKHVLLSKI